MFRCDVFLKRHEAVELTLPDGRPVHLEVLDMTLGLVRLGVLADRDIPVHRQEIQQALAGPICLRPKGARRLK